MTKWIQNNWKYFAGPTVGIAAVVAVIYGAQQYIDSRITRVLNDTETLRRIAAAAKPEMIIDSRGAVLADMGAWDYIADLQVTPSTQSTFIADSLVITPKKYMATPPLVTPVDGAFLTVTPVRGTKLAWILQLDYGSWDDNGPNRLRIEIIDK